MSPLAASSGRRARAATLIERDWRMLIGGALVEGAATYPTHSPHDGRELARVPLASAQDVDRAVIAARKAFPAWRALSVGERGAYLEAVIAALRAHAEDLAIADAADSGNPVSVMVGEVEMACEMLDWFRGVAWRLTGETLPSSVPTRDWLLTRREPYGVVGRITAFNHPILFAAQKLGAPLMAGNTLVLKVPEQTPLAPLLLGEVLRDVLPPGVLNVVTGDGPTTGDALVRHPDVKRLALIGSVTTGQRIQRSAAEAGVKHVSLELGGKNALIVFPDADLEGAAHSAVGGMNFTRTAGQSCGSTTRLFLHDDVHDAVLERVVAGARAVRIGHPLDPETQMGPLVSDAQFKRVLSSVETGIAEGATLACGGRRPAGDAFAAGCYFAPTVFSDVQDHMRIANEEIFGPVLSVLRFSDRDEVVARANGLPFGLTGGVWTRDLATALDVADRLDTGYVWVNGSARHFLGAPFSGRKSSGTDSEEGFEELVSYTQPKTIAIAIGVS